MKNIFPILGIDYQNKLTEIADLKRKGNKAVLESLIPDILQRFLLYELNSKNLESLASSSSSIANNKNLLISLYDSPLGSTDVLLNQITD